uniref:DRBM domain-containing protein n=1 Tax=Macrostomum lignano TaxID=282301 RepID=A0A1I8FT30_9PLAT
CAPPPKIISIKLRPAEKAVHQSPGTHRPTAREVEHGSIPATDQPGVSAGDHLRARSRPYLVPCPVPKPDVGLAAVHRSLGRVAHRTTPSCQPVASPGLLPTESYRGIVRPVERALPRPVRTDHAGRRPAVPLAQPPAFVRSLWGVEIVVAHVTKQRRRGWTGAETAGTAELHLVTPVLPVAAASGKNVVAPQRASTKAAAVNRIADLPHSWTTRQPEAGHAPASASCCGKLRPGRPACRFNRIDSGIGGVARCLCEPAVPAGLRHLRSLRADCVAAAWALHALCVHPTGALPGLHQTVSTGGDGGSDLRRALSRRRLRLDDQGPAVELCPRLSLQSASKPEVTFCRNQLIAQDELIVCLKENRIRGTTGTISHQAASHSAITQLRTGLAQAGLLRTMASDG